MMAGDLEALALDDEEAIEGLTDWVLRLHERLACSGTCYRPGHDFEGDARVRERVGAVLASCFGTIFGQGPSARYADAFEQMSVLAVLFAKDHIFADGNKRTALVFSLSLLELAGTPVVMSDAEAPEENGYFRWIQDAVSGARNAAELASELRAGTIPA